MRIVVVPLLAALALSACAAPVEPPAPVPSASATPSAPAGGVLLTQLGFTHAPSGFSLPAGTHVSDRIDQTNQVTAVLTAPDGHEIAGYLREHLPELGYEITGDKDNALLFTDGTFSGAFYAEGTLSSLTLRRDQESPG